jgi:hypothetical protein
MNFVVLSTGLILFVSMLPIFGGHKEWLLLLIIFEKHFGTWGIIFNWIFFDRPVCAILGNSAWRDSILRSINVAGPDVSH